MSNYRNVKIKKCPYTKINGSIWLETYNVHYLPEATILFVCSF